LTIPNQDNLDFVIGLMVDRFGDNFRKHVRDHLKYVTIYINNKSYLQLKGLQTKVYNGDEIILGHVIAGG
jgi:hypothetical protein